jgi:hypothetical protein
MFPITRKPILPIFAVMISATMDMHISLPIRSPICKPSALYRQIVDDIGETGKEDVRIIIRKTMMV